ncbi:nuclear transport factor 2 family protein [Georgenia deserti]|uniref:Nuclear transport factor 2 family protein n=1 Tax=Georgenia deserti TaxID=2093781 RepID=A0ABW4L630_9MICO
MSVLPAHVRAAITDLNARFAWALDSHDFAALRELLTPDVHYVSVGREFHDADSVIASFEARTGARTTRHGLGNLLLEERPDGAVRGRSSWHTFAAHTALGTDGTDSPGSTPGAVPVPEVFMVADFTDSYVRDDAGDWRIAERIITPVFRNPHLAPT